MNYQFICMKCKKKFSYELRVVEYTKTESFSCPNCHSVNTKRTYDVPSVHYKGIGFTKSLNKE